MNAGESEPLLNFIDARFAFDDGLDVTTFIAADAAAFDSASPPPNIEADIGELPAAIAVNFKVYELDFEGFVAENPSSTILIVPLLAL